MSRQLEEQDKLVKKQLAEMGLSELSEAASAEVEAVGEQFFGEETYARENKLRKWVRTIVDGGNISDAEEILKRAKAIALAGQTRTFHYKGTSLVVTATGEVMTSSNYIKVLEDLVVKSSESEIITKDYVSILGLISANISLLNVGFYENIKLAFKSLFRRTNG